MFRAADTLTAALLLKEVKMICYRVIIKCGYKNAYFDFDSSSEACSFAEKALLHGSSEDDEKLPAIILKVINTDVDQEEDE